MRRLRRRSAALAKEGRQFKMQLSLFSKPTIQWHFEIDSLYQFLCGVVGVNKVTNALFIARSRKTFTEFSQFLIEKSGKNTY
jgi:hypothetical protein